MQNDKMHLTKVKAVIEALVFASSEPVQLRELAEITELNEHTVKQLIYDLIEEYKASQKGIRIKELAGGYHFVTNPEYADFIEKLKKVPRPSPLSQAALETIAIIAYKQPITRAEIEALRGVRVESSLSTLLERGLVQEAGRKDSPGRPIIYTTTEKFLGYFGLNSLDALPKIDDWTDDSLLDLVMNSD